MPVIVFDLDDTLYEEVSFVRSGFNAVAAHLQKSFGIDSITIIELMWNILQQHGRGEVFDKMLSQLGVYSKKNVRSCLALYRSHLPNIQLYQDAVNCMEKFSGYSMYIVTDGNKYVQYNKLVALGLYNHSLVKGCMISRRFGLRNEKPSPHCFLKIAELEKVSPNEVYYIGDNPNKDFVGIKPLGFQTVRLLRGNFKDLEMPLAYEAHYSIQSLDQLKDIINLPN